MAQKSRLKASPKAQITALDDILSEFLQHSEKRVLVLKGKWGVGKTYAWKKYFEIHREINEFAISYVSLFGVKDLNEVRQLIIQKAVPKNIKQLKSISKVGVPLLEILKKAEIPYLKYALNASANIAPLLIRKFLICFDDIERKSAELSLASILGLVSVLKEENDCRIVLIFNEDQIEDTGDKESLKKYREKVVDQEVEYEPPTKDNVRLIFPSPEFLCAQERGLYT